MSIVIFIIFYFVYYPYFIFVCVFLVAFVNFNIAAWGYGFILFNFVQNRSK